MKILQVSHGLPPKENAGVELYTFYVSKALADLHHQVHIFCREEDPKKEEFSSSEEEMDGLRVTRVVNNLTRISDPRVLYDNHFFDQTFLEILRKEKPDLVHFQHIFGLSALLLRIAKEEGIPVVLTLHDFFILCHRIHLLNDDNLPCSGPRYGLECVSCLDSVSPPQDIRTKVFLKAKDVLPFPIIKWTKRFFIPPKYLCEPGYEVFHRYRYMYEIFKIPDVLLAPSCFVKDLFLKYYPFIQPKIIVLPLGIPPVEGQRRSKEANEKIRFCYFGNILPTKGLHVLIDAFKALPRWKATLTIYGSRTPWTEAYYDWLKRQASGFEVDFRESFKREDLPEILSHQDVAVLPSICPESFSFVIREANSMDLPVIASRIGAIPEAIREGENGLLFEPGNIKELRDCMLRFVEEPRLLQTMALKMPKIKSMAEHASELIEIYKGIVGKGGMRSFNYSDYESRMMNSELIRMLQRPRVHFFKGCKKVLDMACGPGVFLGLLREEGIEAVGVDRNEEIVKKACSKHFKVIHSDIFDYLEKVEERYDGVFCSHFLEHLPFDRVVRLIELITKRLDPGGVLVLVFPNPESIRLHLFGFWRDPEHVRFYTGNLITSVCQYYGLRVEYSNEEETPNLLETPHIEPISMSLSDREGREFLSRPQGGIEPLLQEVNKTIGEFNKKMEKFSEAVNEMWARDDEVVLVCRK